MEKIKITRETVVLDNAFVRVENNLADVELSDGKVVEGVHRFIVKKKPAAVVVAVKKNAEGEEEVALVRQRRYGNDNQWMWELPAGVCDEGEDPMLTALRETEEELGFEVPFGEKMFEGFSAPGWSTEVLHFCYVELGDSIGQSLDEDEDIEVQFVSKEKLREMIYSEEIFDTKTVAGALFYFGWTPDKSENGL